MSCYLLIYGIHNVLGRTDCTDSLTDYVMDGYTKNRMPWAPHVFGDGGIKLFLNLAHLFHPFYQHSTVFVQLILYVYKDVHIHWFNVCSFDLS